MRGACNFSIFAQLIIEKFFTNSHFCGLIEGPIPLLSGRPLGVGNGFSSGLWERNSRRHRGNGCQRQGLSRVYVRPGRDAGHVRLVPATHRTQREKSPGHCKRCRREKVAPAIRQDSAISPAPHNEQADRTQL